MNKVINEQIYTLQLSHNLQSNLHFTIFNKAAEVRLKNNRHTTFICGAQVANSRSQFLNVESGATTKCGKLTFSSIREANSEMLCIVFPAMTWAYFSTSLTI